MDFQGQLLKVEQALSTDEVKALSFLCTDILDRDLSSVDSARQLFTMLADQDELSPEQPDLLVELLTVLRRQRLLRQLGVTDQVSTARIPPYRKLLYNLYEDITEDDLNNIKFLLREDLSRKCSRESTTLEVFLEMEHKDLLSDTKLDVLEKIFEQVCPMLKRKIHQFMEQNVTRGGPVTQETGTGRLRSASDLSVSNVTRPQMSSERRSSCEISVCFDEYSQPLAESSLSPSSTSLDVPRFSNSGDEALSHGLSRLSIKNENCAASKVKGDVKTLSSQNQIASKNGTSGLVHFPARNTSEKDLEEYPMTRARRGYCLVINNYNFENSAKRLNNREGTDIDRDSLEIVFKWLGFEVLIHDDCTKAQILSAVQELRIRDHSQMDCLVCCILSHGLDGGVYGVDGQEVQLKQLTEPFSALQCPSLKEKPKLFFIQACQGNYEQEAVHIQADGPICSDAVVPQDSIPASADFLMSMATVPEFVSYRDKKLGSWFIQSLCQNLLQMVPRSHDLLTILTKVNADVSKKTDKKGEKKQMPQPAFSLRMKVVFPIPTGSAPSPHIS